MSDKLVDKVKKFMGFADEEEEFEEEIEEETNISNTKTTTIANKIVNIHATTQMKVMIYEPKTYDEATGIVDNLKNRKAVIVNLENIEDSELAKTIFDFINGAVYALEGSIQKVSKGIFILAPSNIDIDGNIRKEIEGKVLFPWNK
ncbi:cell division inhibitor SepF [Alkalithermobacter thermoalcaliphilus JW-YL-7 = DSM 7308]|uniref:Cell division protein SepF n=1 Tax=Alkalithermobacter thermoalcaliphilus JW-YL-7 = DSM 7308 TaxID=1121328 RepID=A0A150FPM7_CLOPD|nr:Cell division protein sepF [[Clostridium] paradoxum JW-YL-7 = DSM 7308]SHK97439.1 cell division inhibitor SepF [[Clostridium] paradoxum JW-YL-7 = DSM 7308]